ncbi:hypothetical protein ACN38_g491 [Penicillium nordicum]|uniref:Uncharacterized protein n=1 Tax=Penicillium nordicum TaxID=229535 RepID=A0A0M8PHY5_9EURO|nr:hypothetical protein ACN38_g491 [Penicillium nordicum]
MDMVQDLAGFIVDNPISILAIAFDPNSTTDYILVYKAEQDGGSCRARWICSDAGRNEVIKFWWDEEM